MLQEQARGANNSLTPTAVDLRTACGAAVALAIPTQEAVHR